LGTKTSDLVAIKETPEFETYIKRISHDLMGKDIIIRGKVKLNDFSNNYEISVYDFKSIEPLAELKVIMKQIEG